MKQKFIRLDADNVGDKIELSLLNNDIAKAKSIHNSIRESMKTLLEKITNQGDMEIIMVGCDDILIKMEASNYKKSFLEELMIIFNGISDCTISVGVGNNLHEALLNLNKAKLSGKNIIIESH